MTGIQPNVTIRVVKWSKERKPLDVIHVGMSEKEIRIEKVCLFEHDFLAQESNSRTCIYDNSLFSTSNLETGGVPPIFDRLGSRARNASAGAPKL